MAENGRERPLLLGHRGQRHTRRRSLRFLEPELLPPDNTLAAFELSMERGCDGFEFDVRYTHDRRGVICHDPEFAGFKVANTHYDALRQASVPHERRQEQPDDEHMPCLEDVLARFSDRAYLDIEIKIPGFEEDVVAAIHHNRPQRGFVVSSFLPPVLRRFHELDPDLPLGFIFKERRFMAEWKELPVSVLIPHTSLVTHLLVREWHAEGKQVFVWTVNREAEMRRLGLWSVDGIISDDTKLLAKVFGVNELA